MMQRLDGSPVEIPHISVLSPRFRLNDFLTWAAKDHPARLHQVAAAVLMQNGLNSNHLRILREFEGIELTRPTEFNKHFNRIEADKPAGHIHNKLFSEIMIKWAGALPGQKCDRQKLRQLAALLLYENGFTTTNIAIVLGWQAKGSASRAMGNARDDLQRVVETQQNFDSFLNWLDSAREELQQIVSLN